MSLVRPFFRKGSFFGSAERASLLASYRSHVVEMIVSFAMANLARKPATYEDVLAAPAHLVAELLFGVLHTHPRPAVTHARAHGGLFHELNGPFDRGQGGPGGWVILIEPEIHLGADILVPDIAGWRRETMPSLPMNDAFITRAPDWVCEVLSPSTEAIDRSDKMDVYAREGVTYVWLIDPVDKTLEAYKLEAPRWLRIGAWRNDARVRVEPFDAIELDLAVLWAS